MPLPMFDVRRDRDCVSIPHKQRLLFSLAWIKMKFTNKIHSQRYLIPEKARKTNPFSSSIHLQSGMHASSIPCPPIHSYV